MSDTESKPPKPPRSSRQERDSQRGSLVQRNNTSVLKRGASTDVLLKDAPKTIEEIPKAWGALVQHTTQLEEKLSDLTAELKQIKEALGENTKSTNKLKHELEYTNECTAKLVYSPGYHNQRVFTYRKAQFVFWSLVTIIMVLDRFYGNVWPRQSFKDQWPKTCRNPENPNKSRCGSDFFCEFGSGEAGCLKDGEAGAKMFDALARISARVIISLTTVCFMTMCTCTWNRLAEVPRLRGLLWNVREDNMWLHRQAGTLIGITTVIHVWSLFLPSILDGYTNVVTGGPISAPLQVSLGKSQVDIVNKIANWGTDDVWRLFWMTAIFCVLFPLSRSVFLLKKSYSLSMWLHVAIGFGFFFDSARRRTHPHVWLLNLPVFFWYAADRIASITWYRCDRKVVSKRIMLDDDYMVVLWKNQHVARRVCDVYWVKQRLGTTCKTAWRPSEWAHPFTVASSFEIEDEDVGDREMQEDLAKLPAAAGHSLAPKTILAPTHMQDTSWKGHRFQFHKETDSPNNPSVAMFRTKIVRQNTLLFTEARRDSEGINENPTLAPLEQINRRHSVKRNVHSRKSSLVLETKEIKPESGEEIIEEWNSVACMRVHRSNRKSPANPRCPLALPHFPETQRIADHTSSNVPLSVFGPYRSEYGRLDHLITEGRTPFIVIATGAGAGLVLDTVSKALSLGSHLRLREKCKVIYSTWSVPLLQFVTDSLSARRIANLDILATITRLGAPENVIVAQKSELEVGRIDFLNYIREIKDPRTEVFFCGAGFLSAMIAKECKRKGLLLVGSSVEN